MKVGDIRKLNEQGAKAMNACLAHFTGDFEVYSGDEVMFMEEAPMGAYWCTPLSQNPSKKTRIHDDDYTWALSEEDFIKE